MSKHATFIALVGCVAYFFLFIFIATIIGEADISDYLDVNETQGGYCDSPRIAFDPNFEEYSVYEYSKRCVHTRVAFDELGCGTIDGCTWENETSFWFWTSPAGCVGNINVSYYAEEEIGAFTFVDLCRLNGTQEEDTCYNVGCQWNENAEEIDVSNSKNLIEVTGELFTFRYDFGFTGTWNIAMTFAFFYVPFLLILGFGYLLLPFIH